LQPNTIGGAVVATLAALMPERGRRHETPIPNSNIKAKKDERDCKVIINHRGRNTFSIFGKWPHDGHVLLQSFAALMPHRERMRNAPIPDMTIIELGGFGTGDWQLNNLKQL
jgi:hypothetical protein